MTKIIAVTACPSGVAHTYMAAEALESAAKAKGWDVKVETQGSIGLENELTPADVAEADMVILTKDIGIKFEERFAGKTIVRVNISDAVKRADAIMNKIGAHRLTLECPMAQAYLSYAINPVGQIRRSRRHQATSLPTGVFHDQSHPTFESRSVST
jgi:fructose-specific PTS system IIB-like component